MSPHISRQQRQGPALPPLIGDGSRTCYLQLIHEAEAQETPGREVTFSTTGLDTGSVFIVGIVTFSDFQHTHSIIIYNKMVLPENLKFSESKARTSLCGPGYASPPRNTSENHIYFVMEDSTNIAWVSSFS